MPHWRKMLSYHLVWVKRANMWCVTTIDESILLTEASPKYGKNRNRQKQYWFSSQEEADNFIAKEKEKEAQSAGQSS